MVTFVCGIILLMVTFVCGTIMVISESISVATTMSCLQLLFVKQKCFLHINLEFFCYLHVLKVFNNHYSL